MQSKIQSQWLKFGKTDVTEAVVAENAQHYLQLSSIQLLLILNKLDKLYKSTLNSFFKTESFESNFILRRLLSLKF